MDWRPVPYLPGYEASDRGEIRKIGRTRTLPRQPDEDGHLWVQIGEDRYYSVLLMLDAFGRPGGDRQGVHFRDNNRTNITLGNVEWRTEDHGATRGSDLHPRRRYVPTEAQLARVGVNKHRFRYRTDEERLEAKRRSRREWYERKKSEPS